MQCSSPSQNTSGSGLRSSADLLPIRLKNFPTGFNILPPIGLVIFEITFIVQPTGWKIACFRSHFFFSTFFVIGSKNWILDLNFTHDHYDIYTQAADTWEKYHWEQKWNQYFGFHFPLSQLPVMMRTWSLGSRVRGTHKTGTI